MNKGPRAKIGGARWIGIVSASIMIGYLGFAFFEPIIEKIIYRKIIRGMIEKGNIELAIRSCAEKWRSTHDEYYRILGSKMMKQEEQNRVRAEECYEKARALRDRGQLSEAMELVNESIRLSTNPIYEEEKRKIGDEQARIAARKKQEEEQKRIATVDQRIRERAQRIFVNERGSLEAVIDGEMSFVNIPAGEFLMGSAKGPNDRVQHMVFLDSFWLAREEISNIRFKEFAAAQGIEWAVAAPRIGRTCEISWDVADRFCEWLSKRTGLAFKLPSEAQWERGARLMEDATENKDLDSYNYYGIRGMYDDLREWCYDFFDKGYYARSPLKNPVGPEKGDYHEAVVRGSSKRDSSGRPDISLRFKASLSPKYKSRTIGIRVVMQ
jgi:formylglycine-generating enzyme required for sulfatase activity